jgi:hypothetical protein
MLVVFVIGIAARLLVSRVGHNYDFDSFVIVSNLFDYGYNVYSHTTRYNYGPIWFHLLGFMSLLASHQLELFRYILVAFLSLTDTGIFLILWQKLGRLAGSLFFLNPISIIITGYHNQFDNLAILLAMLSVQTLRDNFENQMSIRKTMGLLLLGLSLMTKHIFFAFPLWLAMKQKGLLLKIVTIFIPIFVFILGFFPYWNEGKQGILQNVFFYNSWNNEFFYTLFVPKILPSIITSRVIWIILLLGFGVAFQNRDGFESLLLYTCILVAASPAIANQYLAIVVPFVSAYVNPFAFSYTLVGTWHLLLDSNGLHIPIFRAFANQNIYYAALITLLCIALVERIWNIQLRRFLRRVVDRVKATARHQKVE